MAITIKKYDRQVEPLTPNVPDPINPGAVRGAFGEDVYRANQSIGESVSKIGEMLGKHAIEQKKLQDDAFVAEMDFNDSIHAEDSLKSNLSKLGLNTQGTSNALLNERLKHEQEILSTVKDPEIRNALANNMRQNTLSAYNRNVTHETTQYRAGLIDKIDSSQKLKIQYAFGINNSNDLTKQIGLVVDLQHKKNNASGADEDTAKLNINDAIAKTVSNSVMGTLRDDPTGIKSMTLLKDYEKVIGNPEEYDKIKTNIFNGSEKLLKEMKVQKQISQLNTEADLVKQTILGDRSIDDVSRIGDMIKSGEIKQDFGEAVIRAINHPDDLNYNLSDEDVAFVESLKSVFESSNPEDINKSIKEILDNFSSSKIDQKKMALLVDSALKFGGENRAFKNMMNLVEDNELDSADASKEFTKALQEGKPPSVAAQIALVNVGFTEEKQKEYNTKEKLSLGYSGDIQPPKGQGMVNVIEPFVNLIKGGEATLFSSPQLYGSMLKEYGENFDENRNFWGDLLSLPTAINKYIINSIPLLKDKQKEANDKITALGQKIIDDNIEWISQQKLTRPEASGLNQVSYDLGSGFASVLSVLGMAVITKNPVAISAMFGAMSKAHAYEELRKSGKSPSTSSNISTVQGLTDFGIQLVGLKFMLKNYGGKLMNAGMRAAVLGGQSGVQSISSDVILSRDKKFHQVMNDAVYNALIGTAIGLGTSAILDMAIKDGTVRKIKQNTIESTKVADTQPNTAKPEIQPQTEFGKKLKQYILDKEKVPLHPSEEGKSAIDKLVDKNESNVKRLISEVESVHNQSESVVKGESGSKKQQIREIPPQFTNPNDPVMLNYLAEFIKPKVVAGLEPSERIKLGNLSLNELRDVADNIGKESNLKDFENAKAKVVILDAIDGINKQLEFVFKDVEEVVAKLDSQNGKNPSEVKPTEQSKSPLNELAKQSPNEALIPSDVPVKVEDTIAPPKVKGEQNSKGTGGEVKEGSEQASKVDEGTKSSIRIRDNAKDGVEAKKGEFVKKNEPSKIETNKSEDVVGGSEKKAKASTDINKAIVEKGMKSLSDEELAGFTSIKKKEQIEKVAGLLEDYPNAVDMAMGKKEVPSDVARQVLFNAVKEKALAENDINTLMDLANSPLAKGRSLAAQELSSAGFNNETGADPVKVISEINKTAEEAVVKATKSKDIKAAGEKTIKELKDVKKNSNPTKNQWADFIRGLQC